MDLPVVRKKPARPRRMLLRGESTIASAGLALSVITLFAMAGSAWLSARTQHGMQVSARVRDVETTGALLAEAAGPLLALDEVSKVRLLVSGYARTHRFEECRIVLPEGQVVAAARPADITLASLPETWSELPVESQLVPPLGGDVSVSYPIEVLGRGRARLDVLASADTPLWSFWHTQTGIGLIGAAALLGLLVVYRRMRSRMRALSYIRESLLALDAGETSLAALTVKSDLGTEASAWNELLTERERLQQVLVTKRLLELPSARHDRNHDLSSMCDAMPQGLILVDDELRVNYANGAAALYLGSAREEVLGVDVADVIHEEDILRPVRKIAAGVLRHSASVEFERGEHGTNTVLRFGIRPVRREDESAVMIVIEDITQQRLADASRKVFVDNVVHELRTPLTSIGLAAHTLMDDDIQDAGEHEKALNTINNESRRLERLVDDMLNVAEMEAGTQSLQIDDVPLAQLFDDLRSDFSAAAREKDLTFRLELPPKLPVIQADRNKLTQAIHNLVGNAMKYTPSGGQITIELDCENGVTVKVIDNGLGMSPDDQAHVFEKFYRAKDTRIADIRGSGLGLPLAREVIRLHGGDITVESELDRGSTFVLTVPADVAAAA